MKCWSWDRKPFTHEECLIIGRNLKRLRKYRGLTVEQLSNKLEVSKRTVYDYESGKHIRHGMLEKFSKFYNVQWQTLLVSHKNPLL